MAEETTQAQSETQEPKEKEQSIRTVLIGGCIILWLTAIYMINLMNGISQKLDKIDLNWQSSVSILSQRPLESYQVVDKDGNLVYSFQVDPKVFETPEGEMMDMQGLEGSQGMGGGSGTK